MPGFRRAATPFRRLLSCSALSPLLLFLLLLTRSQLTSCALTELEEEYVAVPLAGGARESLKFITSKPHVAGTPGDHEVKRAKGALLCRPSSSSGTQRCKFNNQVFFEKGDGCACVHARRVWFGSNRSAIVTRGSSGQEALEGILRCQCGALYSGVDALFCLLFRPLLLFVAGNFNPAPPSIIPCLS